MENTCFHCDQPLEYQNIIPHHCKPSERRYKCPKCCYWTYNLPMLSEHYIKHEVYDPCFPPKEKGTTSCCFEKKGKYYWVKKFEKIPWNIKTCMDFYPYRDPTCGRPFKCIFCCHRYKTHDALTHHMKEHDNKVPYRCYRCENKDLLKRDNPCRLRTFDIHRCHFMDRKNLHPRGG